MPCCRLLRVTQPLPGPETGSTAAPTKATSIPWFVPVFWGVVPVALVAGLTFVDHIPGTSIDLTVPYAAEGPGPTFNTLGEVEGLPVIQIEGADVDEVSGNLDMTTVSVRTGMTAGQYVIRSIFTDDTMVPIEHVIPADMSEEEMVELNKQAFLNSESAATVAAMRYLDKPTRVVVFELMDGAAAEGTLEAGDTITRIDGEEVGEPKQVQELIAKHAPGDEVDISFTRGEEEKQGTVTLGTHPKDDTKPLLGVTMTSEPDGDIKVNYNLNDIGGPSAGMMFSLAVIDKLSPGKLNGGKFVAGTGTIAEDGEVGPIGGIQHKIEGAKKSGAELFLAPAENCEEANKADAGDMVVAKVDTLDDAVKAMEDFSAGRDVKTCAAK